CTTYGSHCPAPIFAQRSYCRQTEEGHLMSQANVSTIEVRGHSLKRNLGDFDKESAFVLIAGLLMLVLMPLYAEVYTLITATIYVSLCILAVSLGLVW